METNNLNLNDIATVVAALVAVALALATAMGPTVMYITEALKKAFNVSDGKGGLVALAISIFLTAVLSVVTTYTTQEGASIREYIAALGIGSVIGIFVGGGAVQSYKAAGSINTDKVLSSSLVASAPISTFALASRPATTPTPLFSDDVDDELSTHEIMAKGPNPDEQGNCF